MPAFFDSSDDVSGIRVVDAGSVALAEGEELLARDLLEAAAERFEAAAAAFSAQNDPAGSARALLGLGRVLLGLENPACREVLEDAGTYLEDLGDERGVLNIDRLLRAAESSFPKGSPRSFHSTHLSKVVRTG